MGWSGEESSEMELWVTKSTHLWNILVYSNQFGLNSDLGRTATLFDISDKEGITTFWISYWKDLNGLQEFSTSSAHRLGQNAYNRKRFPYMGIMHETYHSPKGSWETIYDNTPPLGLGKWTFQTLQHCKVFFVNPVGILQEKPSTWPKTDRVVLNLEIHSSRTA